MPSKPKKRDGGLDDVVRHLRDLLAPAPPEVLDRGRDLGAELAEKRRWSEDELRAFLDEIIERPGPHVDHEARLFARVARAAISSEAWREQLWILAAGKEGFFPEEMIDRARMSFALEMIRETLTPLFERMGEGLAAEAKALRVDNVPPSVVTTVLRRIEKRPGLAPDALALVLFAKRATRSSRDLADFARFAAHVRGYLERAGSR